MSTELQPHQQRVVTERAELDEKRAKLEAFIGSDTYFTLSGMEQNRLQRQHWAMTDYSNILSERIRAFHEAEDED